MTPRKEPIFIQRYIADSQALREEIVAGLTRARATLSPKHFYDRLGSQLFTAITELPEYYPTRTEAGILAAHGAEIARQVGAGSTWIDLGAGDCSKSLRLFPLLAPARYVAIDISVDFLRDALAEVQRQYPALDLLGIGLDFSASLGLPPEATIGRPVFFYPGSSIGNFTPGDALAFLRRVRAAAAGGGLLIGVDVVKPAEILEPAYDDALGVTAAFNLNALLHVNRLIGSDFDVARWKHASFYNARLSRIEMHLQARTEQIVAWPGGSRAFAAGERIHTENSYKYARDAFAALLREAGFGEPRCWTDERGWFAVYWANA